MSVLPSYIPNATRESMAAALTAAGLQLGPVKPRTRLTHTVDHDGTEWKLTYIGPMGDTPVWCLAGPSVEHGIAVTAAEVAEHITSAAH